MPKSARSLKYPSDKDSYKSEFVSDDHWEDVLESDTDKERLIPSRNTPSPSGSARSITSPRKRKPLHKTTFTATSPRKPVVPSLAPKRPPRNIITTEEIVDGTLSGASFTLRYLFDIFSTAIYLLRRPLYFLVFLWLLALIISRVSDTLRGAFAPLCYLPGLYGSRFCRSPDLQTRDRKAPRWADYPRLVDVQSNTFEQLLDESVGGSGLSLEIKKAELATTDLVTLVRVSNLHSRETLGNVLVEFVDDAKKTGRGLQRLSSKIGGAVDNILAVNDYALHAIETAHTGTPGRFSLQKFVPWSSPSRPTNEIVTETFTEAMSVLSTAMQRLILEAEMNLAHLDRLEEHLSTLHELVSREDLTLSLAKSELLSELWTMLGGNRRALRGFEDHLFLLKGLGAYRKRALAHVVAALHTLREMSSDMEDLRERVAAPELTGTKIPVQVHMKSIKSGLERLKERRIRARRLGEEAMNRVLGVEPGNSDSE